MRIAQAAGAVNDMVGLTHDLRQITGGIIDGRGTVGQLMTNRALYDQLINTLGRANTMLGGFENPNGSFGRMLRDPTLYEKFVGVIQSADSLVVALNDKNGKAQIEPDVGAFRGQLAHLRIQRDPDNERYGVLAVATLPGGKILAIYADCPFDRIDFWRNEFKAVIETVRRPKG